jgi:nitric oxide reductase activation protein
VAESAKGFRGISGHVNAFDNDTFFRLGDLDHPAISAVESGGGNNDAGALSKAAELALKSGKKNRLLIMISDGSPTECSVESLRSLVARLTRRGGFVCAQVAVDEMEEICFPHFVDLSKYPLDEAVGRFGKLLMKLTEAWR